MPFARVLPVVRNPYSKDSSGTFGFFTQLSMEALRVPAVFDLLNCAVHCAINFQLNNSYLLK